MPDIFERLTDPNRFVSKKTMLDGCGDKDKSGVMLDGVDAIDHELMAGDAIRFLKIKAASAIQQWADDDVQLGEGESHADRLNALMIGCADENADGEISEDEADAYDVVVNFAVEYLIRHGVDESDAVSLLEDYDNETGDRIRDLLIDVLPSDEDAENDINHFVYAKDDAVLDSVFKKVMAIVGGIKKRINKRISGTAHRSGAQKAATRKAQRKSHGASAMMKRAKSMLKRSKMGLKDMVHRK